MQLAYMMYDQDRRTPVCYCTDPDCQAELCSWEEAQGWLYLEDGSDYEYLDTCACHSCRVEYALPTTAQAEQCLDTKGENHAEEREGV